MSHNCAVAQMLCALQCRMYETTPATQEWQLDRRTRRQQRQQESVVQRRAAMAIVQPRVSSYGTRLVFDRDADGAGGLCRACLLQPNGLAVEHLESAS